MEEAFEFFLRENTTITKTCVKFKIRQSDFIDYLHSKRYFKAALKVSRDSIIKYHDAAEEYASSDFWNISKKCICDKYGISVPTNFAKYLKEYYPEVRVLNEHVFDFIDTEEKAYWLGFLFADGYISSKDNSFELSLSIKDIDHVNKFAKFIEYKRKVVDAITRCRLSFRSSHVWNTLNDYGCTPRKSLTLKFPDESIFIESDKYSKKELIRHFIRGYWDGDGCLTYKRESYPTISVISTKDFLEKVQFYLGTCKTLYQNSKNNDITMVLKYNGIEAFKIVEYLYSNSNIYLDRKYEKFKNEYCRLYEKSDRLLQTNIGEGCDANTEISMEPKESMPS